MDFLEAGAPDALHTAGFKKEMDLALAASERLRSWLTAFNSSSQALMETIAQIRGLNEQVAKQAGAGGAERPAAEPAAHQEEIAILAKSVVAALNTFQHQVEAHIREDQRIIVVDSNGFQLGLVVDHVNEVLGVREEAIETPPSLGRHEGVTLSGIAKLDEGNRLILLLSTGDLLDRKSLAEMAGGFEETADKEEAKLARKADDGAAEYDLQLVTFLLGQEEYGIPIASIQEIDRLSRITKTPKAPRFVDGVTNLRGEVIPVLSTRTLFALEAKVADDRTRVIIVDLGGAKTGLVVDSVKEVMSISSRNIAPPPASIANGGEGQFISGIGKVDDGKRMIVLLDVARVLTRGEQGEVAALGRTA
jgi:purine-binding chemotaxis protein CheW